MSDRNRNDYYNLDNFDDSIDSRDYRRRQPNRRQTSYNGRPSYDRRRLNKMRNYRRTRNRIIIVVSLILVVTLVVLMIVLAFNGCGKKDNNKGVSTQPKQSSVSETSNTDEKPQPKNTDEKLAIDTFIEAEPKDDNSSGYNAGSIYVWNQAGFEVFGGDEERAKLYSDTVNGLADKVPDMNVYSMIVPNHTEMGLPRRLWAKNGGEAYTNSQADSIRSAYESMDKDKVTPINAYNYLSEHCNEYIYFNSDHHWTGLGSYYAYKAFADTLGLTALSLDDCEEKTIDGFTGSLTNNADGLKSDTVHYWHLPYSVSMEITHEGGSTESYNSPYFDEEANGSLTYGVFIWGDNPLTVMKSNSEKAESGRKIMVVKESYGNAFVPYLTQNFEEVHVADMRSFRQVSDSNLQTYCRQNGITDLLFINGVMSANNGDLLDSMEDLFK